MKMAAKNSREGLLSFKAKVKCDLYNRHISFFKRFSRPLQLQLTDISCQRHSLILTKQILNMKTGIIIPYGNIINMQREVNVFFNPL
ncbi:hypothetical protein ERHA54_50670 (plasmid) [Erwinia rhapontici]|nr:hypothetical protein ERHA54_50670 [Erwinia rhapontici]